MGRTPHSPLFSHLSPGERRDIITHNVVTEWRRLATSDHASVDILHFHVIIQTWTLDNESLSIHSDMIINGFRIFKVNSVENNEII